MAAGHLHLRTLNGHQWAEEVAVPKLVGLTEARNAQSAEILERKIKGSRYHGGCPMKGVVIRGRRMATETIQTYGKTYFADCLTTVGSQSHQVCLSSMARTWQERSQDQPGQ